MEEKLRAELALAAGISGRFGADTLDDYIIGRAIDKIKRLQADLGAAKRDLWAEGERLGFFQAENLRLREELIDRYAELVEARKKQPTPAEPEPAVCPICEGTGIWRSPECACGRYIQTACPRCGSGGKLVSEPPKKAVYEWVYNSAPSKWTVLTLFRNSCAAGRIMAADGSVLYFVYPNFIERRNERDTQPYSASSIESAKAAVEAVVRAHYGDEA